ncbi:MAG: Gfo/Idh/MocA family oxidoreductase [Rubripirellula sp.]|jgi:predicted dehydrogenase|nr:Gfo/Idh/MocA family oxidoreductase [Planctomycetaceae bacterium]MDF1844176.1 Gfo/Idh/MocA family oxidoreductase [Rubripirellula sp.]
MKLRIGLVGLGESWQTRHRPALRMLQDRFDVRAVFSPVAKLAENTAGEFQADAMDGYRSLVSRCDIDAVMVLQRTWLGWLPMLAACEAGKAIYWAGDIEVDPERDQHVRTAIEESGIAFMAEFPRRFSPATLRLKELIATRLGAPQLLFCHRRMRGGSGGKSEAERSEFIELIDWCRYVVGCEPETVSSVSHRLPDRFGYRCINLDFPATERGPSVTAQISCGDYIRQSWQEADSFRPPSALQICCERGVAFIDLPSTLVWFDDAGRHLESLESELPVAERLLTQFHRSVTSLVRNISDLNDAYRAATLLSAALESEQQGRRIQV